MTGEVRELYIDVGDTTGPVSAVLLEPDGAACLFVLAHGAGAGMRHPFMEGVAAALAERRVATLRYQFPYMEAGRKRPDAPGRLEATVKAAVRTGIETAGGRPLIAGGKSLGGRMTSRVAAKGQLEGVEGLVFLGFPLHAPNKPSNDRAAHLGDVPVPMLFLQGTRDALADLALLTPVCETLGSRATLHVVEGGDHGFKVPKRSGRSDADVLAELGDAVARWARAL